MHMCGGPYDKDNKPGSRKPVLAGYSLSACTIFKYLFTSLALESQDQWLP